MVSSDGVGARRARPRTPAGRPARVRAYVGLGANLGEPRRTLDWAVGALDALPGCRLRGVSRLWATRPVGVVDQPEFLNAVVALDVPSGPDPETGAMDLLRRLKAIEAEAGRVAGPRWGPRVLDLDLLLFGRARVLVERPPELAGASAIAAAAASGERPGPALLQVPHRDVAGRLFVLAPLADLAPRLVPPGWAETVETARRRRTAVEGPDAARPVAERTSSGQAWAPGDPGDPGEPGAEG